MSRDEIETREAEDGFEELLARCLDAHGRGGEAALDALLHEHSEHASRIRRRLELLERFGLLAPDEREPLPQRIGPHAVRSRLGRGGMGDVLLADDAGSGAPIAIKLARMAWTGGEGELLRERFAREVRAVASLRHPGIVGIRGTGEHDGRPWYAMEVVPGATLATLLARLRALALAPGQITVRHVEEALVLELAAPGAVPGGAVKLAARTYVEWVADLVAQVARALEHAHAQGIVHRDVKPSNVLVRPDGRALLFDFGLAHVMGEGGLTRSGDLAGTPSYVAPEQVEGRRGGVDGRTDVWGLGVSLYECLALRRPFEGQGAPGILRAILELEPKSLRALHPEVPRDLESLVEKALEKQPTRRYPSALALAEDLERFLSFRPVEAPPAGWLRRGARRLRRKPALASALALAALVALGTPIGLAWANAAIRAQAQRTQRAAEDAQDQAAARARVVDHLVDLFRPDRAAVEPRVLDETVDRVLAGAGEDELARASLLEATGRVFHNLGEHARALPLLDRAFALRQRRGEGSQASALLLATLSEVHLALGHASTAGALARRALAELAPEEVGAGAALLNAHLAAARAASTLGEHAAAARHIEDARRSLERPDEDPEAWTRTLREAGHAARAGGDLAGAEVALEAALARARRAWLPDARALRDAHLELAAVLEALGRGDDARAQQDVARALEAALERPMPAPAPLLDLEPIWLAEYEPSFQAGVTALQAGDPAAAVERFRRCLELRPRSGVCAYNLACSHALAGDPEAAWPWLELATRWGFTQTPEGLETLRADPDLAGLRAAPHFRGLLEEARRRARDLDSASSRVSVRPPAGEGGDWLVFLHPSGGDGEAALDGAWGAAAQRLGWGLVAPSAPRPLADEPGAGFGWFESPAIFQRTPWLSEDGLLAALRRFQREHPEAQGRTWLAGVGEGATVAFDLALRAPGWWKGVWLADTPLVFTTDERRLRIAAELGLALRLSLDPAREVPGWPSAADYARALAAWLAELGVGARVEVRLAATPADAEACREALAAFRAELGR